MNPTQEELHQLFEYSPATGKLTWRKRDRSQFRTERGWRVFNTRYADKQAGCVKHLTDGYPYIQVKIDGKNYTASKLIWLWMTGEAPPKRTPRIDGNGINLAWGNLLSDSSYTSA